MTQIEEKEFQRKVWIGKTGETGEREQKKKRHRLILLN